MLNEEFRVKVVQKSLAYSTEYIAKLNKKICILSNINIHYYYSLYSTNTRFLSFTFRENSITPHFFLNSSNVKNQASQILFTYPYKPNPRTSNKNPTTYIRYPSARYLYQDPRADGRPLAPPFLCPRHYRPAVS